MAQRERVLTDCITSSGDTVQTDKRHGDAAAATASRVVPVLTTVKSRDVVPVVPRYPVRAFERTMELATQRGGDAVANDVATRAERRAPAGAAARQPTVDEALARRRRVLQIALGVVWLIDAALQFQPYMFTRGFVTDALESTAAGNPWLLYRPMIWADHFMVHGIAGWNVLFATVQLVIALGLFWRPTVRWALGLSVVWGVAVWWFAEGFGGVFTGSSPLSGEPGAVLLYVVAAVLVWPSTDRGSATSVAQRSPWGRAAVALWVLLWGDFAAYLLAPANRSAQGLRSLVAATIAGEPGWVRSLDRGLANLVSGRGVVISAMLALVCVAVALAAFVPSLMRAAVVIAVALAAVIWLIQDFGGVLTSQGTDVNSGPLIALLALTYWPVAANEPRTRLA